MAEVIQLKVRNKGLILSMLFVMFIIPSGVPMTGVVISGLQYNAIPSDWETPQLIADPNLEESPTFEINGSSNEFSYGHDSVTDTVNLTWTHTAGTPLDFKARPDYISSDWRETDCNDFVYFTQSFDWPYETMPRDANMTLEYAVYLNGDFYTEIYGIRWFRLHVFLIDSSDDWRQVYKSFPPYENTTTQRRISFSYFDLFEIWRGMIETNGTQEDPLDILKVAVCLSPMFDFETRVSPSQPQEHPWMNITGSVSCIIETLQLDVLLETDVDTRDYLQPTYNGTWTKPTTIEDFVVADDGSAYTVGRISNYEEQAYCLVITKWSAQATLVWSKTWNGTDKAYGYGVEYYQNYVYVVGEAFSTDNWDDDIDIVLLKLDTSGNIVWAKTWDTDGVSRARKLAIASDGSIYVGGWLGYREPYMWPTTAQVIKFDSNGNHVWNKTIGDIWYDEGIGEYHWDAVYQIEIDSNDALFVRTLRYIMKLDSDGIVQWNYTTPYNNLFALTSDGGCVFIERDYFSSYSRVVIEKISSSGGFEWNQTYAYNLGGTWYDLVEERDIAVAPDGTIHAIIVANRWDQVPMIITCDSQGNYVDTKFLDFEGGLYGYSFRIAVSQSNQIYLAYGAERQALMIYGGVIGFDMITIGLLVGGGAIVVIVIIIAIRKFR